MRQVHNNRLRGVEWVEAPPVEVEPVRRVRRTAQPEIIDDEWVRELEFWERPGVKIGLWGLFLISFGTFLYVFLTYVAVFSEWFGMLFC